MKIVLTLLPERGGRKARNASKKIQLKRVRASDGSMVVLRKLDVTSDSFGRDLGIVFQRNVKKARSLSVKKKDSEQAVRAHRKSS